MATNTGTKKLARDRKNGASRDQWEKRKAETNTARTKQIFVVDALEYDKTDPSFSRKIGHYKRVPA